MRCGAWELYLYIELDRHFIYHDKQWPLLACFIHGLVAHSMLSVVYIMQYLNHFEFIIIMANFILVDFYKNNNNILFALSH